MRYAIRNGEALAISPDAIKRDAGGFFLTSGPGVKENDRIGSIAVVHVRGALAHFDEGEGDSYEAIVARVRAEVEAEEPPSAIVLRLETPGGVAAGAYEASRSLRELGARVPIVAYVDEMAASAGYALASGCGELIGTPSCAVGSIGVISVMASQSEADKAQGIDVRLITSGARKGDGHPHAPITDAAVNAEQGRVTELARQFFALVASARHLTPSQVEGMQAAIYLGKRAQKVGLLDGVLSFDELISTLQARSTKAPLDNVTVSDPPSTPQRHSDLSDAGARAMLTLDAKIIKLEAALAAGGDPKVLRPKLAVLMAAKAEMDDDDDGPPKKKPDDDDGDEDSKAEKARAKADKAKREAEAAKHRAKAEEHRAKAEESEEAAKQCEDEGGGEDAKALAGGSDAALAIVESLTGLKGSEALGAIRALAASNANTAKAVEALQAKHAQDERTALIGSIAKLSTSAEREFLSTQNLETVRGFVKMRAKSGFVNTGDDQLVKPKHVDPTSAEALPASVQAMIAESVASFPGDKKAFQDTLVKAHITARAQAVVNGTGKV